MDTIIIRPDDAHTALLDRAAARDMAKHFQDAIDLSKELVNYGTNLVVRALHSSKRDLICD